MMQKSKRIAIVLLAVALVLALSAGLLLVFLPNGIRASDQMAELSEEDFEYGYASSLAYTTGTEETSGGNGVYGWGYEPEKGASQQYAYIKGITNGKLGDLIKAGVTKLVLNIPAEHKNEFGTVPVRYVAQDAFNDCTLTITDIKMPLSVYWQIKDRFTFDNNSDFARADGLTATFTGFSAEKSGETTLILPSNVWIDENKNGAIDSGEPTYRYTEYLFAGNKSAPYKNLVVMPDVVNIFNGTTDSNADRPKMQGGLLSKSEN